ncbi:TonB-dependent receptor [Flavobacterium sp. LS1R49]|uniref:TonB-dependent receptor n=1 Tax=Flavobacterium shii TaxID=2987687 RepID=A0A9X3C5S1_9FLAO|nr:TonB-dependent receptor [Flavobacterium shii]MCV9927912.1 TonB-dependent receptor [Flavobacterium shii]
MKFLISAFTFLVISSLSCYSQTSGKITGRITLINGQAAESASVSIVENNKYTLTTEDGNYTFSDLIPGKYTIRIQMLGAAQKDIIVELTTGQSATANYQLEKENIQALQEVTVANNTNKFSKKESVYSARLPLKNLENPQVYSIVPKELIIEQMAVDLGSIAKNVPGSGIPMIANQGRVTFRSRGFETEPMVRNGVAGFSYSSIDPANLERIEAIKGPSATLFGTNLSSYGGLYNRVTKKPYNGFGGEVSLYAGSWDFNRITFDVNTPVNADKTVLFRLNGANTFERSFQDIGFTKSLSFAPSFSYQINDRLSLLFDLEFGKAKGTSVLRFNPWTKSKKTESIADMNFPYKQLFGSNDLAYETEMMNIFVQFNYKISEQWTSQSILSRSRTSIDGYISALNGTSDTTLKALVMRGYTSFIATDIQQNFTGDFKIGSHRNRLVVGLDYYNNANTFDRVHITGPEVDFTNPSATSKINRATIDDLASTGVKRAENNGDNSYAVYASDVFNVTDKLLTMVSLRLDRFESEGVTSMATGENKGKYGQTALSPKLGVVYEVFEDKLSVFSNYMNSFTNKTGTDAAGDVFKPEEANQWEIGLKGDLFNHKLVGTISYYDIQVKDMVRTDPNDVNYMIQNGAQSSKGFEVELTANPFTGFNIIAGYAYNDSKMTHADASIEGLRPALSGPDKMVNLWMSYKFQEGKLKGFGAGFGGNYGSSSFQTNTTTRKVIIPSYTILDATVFYDMGRFRIGLKADNITSEKAWSVRLTPQAPLRFMGNVSFKF